jgi:hypothetical protein
VTDIIPEGFAERHDVGILVENFLDQIDMEVTAFVPRCDIRTREYRYLFFRRGG